MAKDSYIRAELLAHDSNELPTLNVNTLLKIEKLLLYLEGKGKSENTRIATCKNLKLLSRRANIDNPQEVELAIARYKCTDNRPASNYINRNGIPHQEQLAENVPDSEAEDELDGAVIL
jgi:hypothetical protein